MSHLKWGFTDINTGNQMWSNQLSLLLATLERWLIQVCGQINSLLSFISGRPEVVLHTPRLSIPQLLHNTPLAYFTLLILEHYYNLVIIFWIETLLSMLLVISPRFVILKLGELTSIQNTLLLKICYEWECKVLYRFSRLSITLWNIIISF